MSAAEPRLLLLKAHVKGHFRDGKWVQPYSTKVPSAAPSAQSRPKPEPQGYHPQMNDDGEDVPIYKLSTATPLEAFGHPEEIATVLPGGAVPPSLHGTPFTSWEDAPHDLPGCAEVEGQAKVDEPEFVPIKGKKVGAGVIVQEPDGRVWVVHPTNGYGGYKGTFAKGTA